LLDSFYQLGKIQRNNISFLLPPISSIKHVIGIIFRLDKNKKVKYDSVKLYEFVNNKLYLWKRDYSGRPGLFLTGNISYDDIKKIKNIYQKSKDLNNEIIQKFIEKKILWLPNGKIVTNKKIIEKLNNDIKNELFGILAEFKKNNNEIAINVLNILTKDEPERVLLTIMIKKNKNSRPLFIGEINSYVKLFKEGILSKKSELLIETKCCICNQKKPIGSFVEKSIPFFVGDKPMHFPSADPRQEYKSFPLCDSCFLEIQKGLFFIQEKLNFRIPSIDSNNRRNLNFWLIPHLNQSDLLIEFKNDLKNKKLYLNLLKDLCSTLKTISKWDSHDRESIEAFLRFSSLFYNIDDHALMRVISYIQGIYPSRLQELFEIKEKIENMYPFPSLSRKINDIVIGFPIIIFFYQYITSQWENAVISILEKMFKGDHIDAEEVIKTILYKIRDLYNDTKKTKNFNFDYLSKTIFQGLMLLEYIISLNKEKSNMVDSKNNHQSNQIKEIENIQKFISTHNNILTGSTERAVFGIGICTGILLEVQAKKYGKTAPFWTRINRFDLDIDRIVSIFNDVKSKLVMYNEHNYDTVINYLGVNEISLLDFSSSKNISREKINFIFSIGLSYGYMLKREYL
jgi:CRISPR-associated protein Cas8b/Csh1 subtype I-B